MISGDGDDREQFSQDQVLVNLPDKVLDLPQAEASRLHHLILETKPFPEQPWAQAVERYLILRWMLGLGPATAKDIYYGLRDAGFCYTSGRTEDSCLVTIHRVLSDRKFHVTDPTKLQRHLHWPREYAFPPPKKS